MIRTFRNLKHWTVEDLARKTGIRAATISRIENGHAKLTIDVLVKVANAFNLPVDIFLVSQGHKTESRLALEVKKYLDQLKKLEDELKQTLWP